MSCYITITYNGIEMDCSTRSSKMFEYCEAAPYEEEEDLKIEQLQDCIDNATEDIKIINKELDTIEWCAKNAPDGDTLMDLGASREELQDELKEAEEARNKLLFLKDIMYENRSKMSNDVPHTKLIAKWVKG